MPISRFAADTSMTGARIALADALVEARLELRVADLLALEVLGQDVVVGLGGRLQELVAAARDLVGQVGRDRRLGLLAALSTRPGLAVNEVDVAAERLGLADRHLQWRDLGAELRAQGVQRGRRVRVLALALGDHEQMAAMPCSAAQRRSAVSVPASTPPDASMAMSAASTASKPSTTSPTKSA